MKSYVGTPLLHGPSFDIKAALPVKGFHWKEKSVIISSYLHDGYSYTGNTVSLYWDRQYQTNDNCDVVDISQSMPNFDGENIYFDDCNNGDAT